MKSNHRQTRPNPAQITAAAAALLHSAEEIHYTLRGTDAPLWLRIDIDGDALTLTTEKPAKGGYFRFDYLDIDDLPTLTDAEDEIRYEIKNAAALIAYERRQRPWTPEGRAFLSSEDDTTPERLGDSER